MKKRIKFIWNSVLAVLLTLVPIENKSDVVFINKFFNNIFNTQGLLKSSSFIDRNYGLDYLGCGINYSGFDDSLAVGPVNKGEIKFVSKKEFEDIGYKLSLNEKRVAYRGYQRLLDEYAYCHKLPPNLIKAVMIVESNSNPYAISNRSAKGLMQLMDGTAQEIAGKLKIKHYNIFDPKINLLFGSYYLKEQLKRFGELELALAAYNMGPRKVEIGGYKRNLQTQKYTKDVMDYFLYLNGELSFYVKGFNY